MLYNSLKFIHIISATIVFTSMLYSAHLWRLMLYKNTSRLTDRIQTQTALIIVPFALLQLATGFTLISVQHYAFTDGWISGSLISFILVLLSWFGFLYFLLLAQQATFPAHPHRLKRYRHLQRLLLGLCGFSLLSMLFFMANKTVLTSGHYA